MSVSLRRLRGSPGYESQNRLRSNDGSAVDLATSNEFLVAGSRLFPSHHLLANLMVLVGKALVWRYRARITIGTRRFASKDRESIDPAFARMPSARLHETGRFQPARGDPGTDYHVPAQLRCFSRSSLEEVVAGFKRS